MRTWWKKLKVSAHLDSGRPLPDKLCREIGENLELKAFSRQAALLPEALGRPERPEPAPWLHAAIMAEVRGLSGQTASERPGQWRAWLVPAGASAVAVLVLWLILGGQAAAPGAAGFTSLIAAGDALEAGTRASETIPAVMMAPLEQELALVNQDLRQIAATVMASVP